MPSNAIVADTSPASLDRRPAASISDGSAAYWPGGTFGERNRAEEERGECVLHRRRGAAAARGGPAEQDPAAVLRAELEAGGRGPG